VNEEVRRIPLTFEEAQESRRLLYSKTIKGRSTGRREGGGRPRAEGELEMLARLANARFKEMFAYVDDLNYEMK